MSSEMTLREAVKHTRSCEDGRLAAKRGGKGRNRD